jgi:hypothetical protein
MEVTTDPGIGCAGIKNSRQLSWMLRLGFRDHIPEHRSGFPAIWASIGSPAGRLVDRFHFQRTRSLDRAWLGTARQRFRGQYSHLQ